jgi:ERCC4-type nuclease
MIFIDFREERSGVPKLLKDLNVPIEIMELKVGDYVVTGEENICVERKDSTDYVGSLTSGSLNNQLVSMSQKYGYSILLVEGTISSALFESQTSRQAYLSSLVGSIIKRSPDGKSGTISMINVETIFDTALCLKYLHDKNNDPNGLIRVPKLNPLRFSEEDAVLAMLTTVPGVGTVLAKNVLDKFHTLKNVANASRGELMEIPKIGKIKATKIFEFFRYYYKT